MTQPRILPPLPVRQALQAIHPKHRQEPLRRHTRRDLSLGHAVGSQFVCDDPFGQAEPLDQHLKKALRSTLIAPGLQKFLQNYPVLINRAPEPEFTAQDHHNNFVEMPDISGKLLAAT